MCASTPVSTLRLFPALAKSTLAGETAAEASPVPTENTAASDFKQLLTLMVLGMSMPGGGSGSVGMGNMMAPLMLSLLEQVLSNQVEVDAGESQASAGVAEEASLEPVNKPSGRPLVGRLTQASHNGHMALDIGVPVGTPVKATMDGQVVYAGWNDQGYGNLVIVENGPYRTYFAHLSKIPVQVGQRIHAREVVGLSGNTGNSTGPHLHYEVRLNNQQLDPARFMPA
jgi:murein DD-endopeptidase MepM/ murein hydrolase activator NlpD